MKGELLDARDSASSSAGESYLRQVIEIARRQEIAMVGIARDYEPGGC
ncbi:MAG: hypothetical protein WB999_13670 [Candidatus Binataceae bacterium]